MKQEVCFMFSEADVSFASKMFFEDNLFGKDASCQFSCAAQKEDCAEKQDEKIG